MPAGDAGETRGGVVQPELVLQDSSLRLRPVVLPGDVAVAAPWYRDPEVLHFSEGEGTLPYDPAMVEQMYRAMAGRCELFIIEVLTANGWLPIGDAGLCGEAGTPIVIGEAAYRSLGLGARVLQLLIARARTLGWPRMVVKGIYTFNERSLRLYTGAGFRVCEQVTDAAGRAMWRLELPLG
jgi:RimJ/RimL family protein N-acetyltransferase